MAELTTTELIERGWTRTLIKNFLPKPDGCTPVNHFRNFRGQDTYAMVKIWNIEQSDEFEQAFMRSWKGRMHGRDPVDVLRNLRDELPPQIEPRTFEQVKSDSLLAEAAGLFSQARARGYRTPHKC